MKIVSIIFCILTIIMLILLSVSIIKNDDKITTNKEKRSILLCLLSFIILMIASITSTLGMNILAIVLFVLFIIVLAISAMNHFACNNIKKVKSKVQKKNPKVKEIKNNDKE